MKKTMGDHAHLLWHGLPEHFGLYSILCCWMIALPIILGWLILRDYILQSLLFDAITLPKGFDPSFFMATVLDSALRPEDYHAPTLLRQARTFYDATHNTLTHYVGMTCIMFACAGIIYAYRHIRPNVWVQRYLEAWSVRTMMVATTFTLVITALMCGAVMAEALLFFQHVAWDDFLFGLAWSPQTALRADQAGASGVFGFIPLMLGTLMITLIALAVAIPIGLGAAMYMHEYAPHRIRAIAKPTLEILAGIPTVVYGFFAIQTVAPWMQAIGAWAGVPVASESALAAGLVMGIMLIPLISSMSDDALRSVPRALYDASLGLGATRSETLCHVVLPAAMPGIVGGILLAMSRAVGETMIVVMAAGLSAQLTINPLESVTTITVQIVALLVGDQEFGSTKTLASFALGFTLFLVTLALNIIALITVKRYRARLS